MYVYHIGLRIEIHLPHVAQQHFASHHFAGVFHELAEQLELLGAERDVAVGAKGGARLGVAFELAVNDDGGVLAPRIAPMQRAQAGDQLVVHRLGRQGGFEVRGQCCERRLEEGVVGLDRGAVDDAVAVIRERSVDWDPGRYTDCYRKRLKKVIDTKQKGKTVKPPQPVDEEDLKPAPDLMAALRKTLEENRRQKADSGKKGGKKKSGATRKKSKKA